MIEFVTKKGGDRMVESAFTETSKAVKTVESATIRGDLANQLLHIERALNETDDRKVTAYLQGLVTTVLILRRSLSARIATNVLSGVVADCENLDIAVPLDRSTDKSRCVWNRGRCVAATNTKCVTIDTAWGCGTVRRVRF
jgi:hypothetical protein